MSDDSEIDYGPYLRGDAKERIAVLVRRNLELMSKCGDLAARVKALEAALRWTSELRYVDRDTDPPDNLWAAWNKLNVRMIEVCNRADAALKPEGGQ